MKALSFFALAAALAAASSARADDIRNPTAIFAGLDKITGRIISFDVAIDETVQFGTLQITPRICLTKPQTEAPLTQGFVEVDDVDAAKQTKRIFSGWMFAASPGLHGVEHPVYDVWLKDCKGGKEVVATPPAAPPNAVPAPRGGAPARNPQRTITPQNPVEPTVDSLPPDPGADLGAPPSAPPQDNSLGSPVEVGPPPGARAPDALPGDPAQPKPKKPKKKPPPAADGAPGTAPGTAPAPAPQLQAPPPPAQPGFLPKIPFFQQ